MTATPPTFVTASDIELALRASLEPMQLSIQDDSHLHAGHAGAKEGRHFSVAIVCDQFNGMSRLNRHRLVYDALRLLIPRGIHALVIDARAPSES